MLDATIPDGSRLQATLGMHVTKRGSSFTIRRFRENPFTPLDLVRFKTMSPEMMAYLWLAIENGQSMLICGGTASGKTTTLNAILLFIPPQMKIVSIEDTRELNLPHENWVPLLTRAGFGGKSAHTGKAAGEIDMFDLLTAALRQRPQYMMIGEVRGPEAFVVFQAMATGKSAYTTFHADDVQAMVHRLENDPINLPRALVAALNLVLLPAQVKVGTDMTRRVKAIVEVVGTDPESHELITNSAYTWNTADDPFNYSGHSYVYETISLARNWNQRRMEQEGKRRLAIFEYMKRMEIKNYRDVAKIVSSYYKDPDGMIKIIRDTLQAQGVAVPAAWVGLRRAPTTDAEGERPGGRNASAEDHEQRRARIVGQQPPREDGPERSDAEDAHERESEGHPPQGPRHLSRHERILKRLEGEEEEAEHQRRRDERAPPRQDRQGEENGARRGRQCEQEAARLAAVGQRPRDDLPDGTEREGEGKEARPDESRLGEEREATLVREPREHVDGQDEPVRAGEEPAKRDARFGRTVGGLFRQRLGQQEDTGEEGRDRQGRGREPPG